MTKTACLDLICVVTAVDRSGFVSLCALSHPPALVLTSVGSSSLLYMLLREPHELLRDNYIPHCTVFSCSAETI